MKSKSEIMDDKQFCNLIEKLDLKPEDFTCLLCKDNETCGFSFNLYNVRGDCLMSIEK